MQRHVAFLTAHNISTRWKKFFNVQSRRAAENFLSLKAYPPDATSRCLFDGSQLDDDFFKRATVFVANVRLGTFGGITDGEDGD